MTVLTKSCLKRDADPGPIPEEHGEETEKVVIAFPEELGAAAHSRSWRGLLLLLLVLSLLLVAAVAITGLELGREPETRVYRYKGYCAIPIDSYGQQMLNPSFYDNTVGLWGGGSRRGAGLTAVVAEVAALREALDIDGSVEKISVLNGPDGRPTTFVHDFTSNYSGIVSESRCFMMELDTQSVLPPALFVLRISREEAAANAAETAAEDDEGWGAGPTRHDVAVQFPPLRPEELPRVMADLCTRRPVYRLDDADPGEAVVVKRSAPARPQRFLHFAGRGLRELELRNVPELLAFEANMD